MSILLLRWRRPRAPITTRWRGLDQATAAAVSPDEPTALAAIVAPPASPDDVSQPGDGLKRVGNELRLDIESLSLAT